MARMGVAHGEAARVTAIQVACGGRRSPCLDGLDCGYACHDSPFLDPYHGVEAWAVAAFCPYAAFPLLSLSCAYLPLYGADDPAPCAQPPTSPFAGAFSRVLPPFVSLAPHALPSSVACSPLASPYQMPLLRYSWNGCQGPAPFYQVLPSWRQQWHACLKVSDLSRWLPWCSNWQVAFAEVRRLAFRCRPLRRCGDDE